MPCRSWTVKREAWTAGREAWSVQISDPELRAPRYLFTLSPCRPSPLHLFTSSPPHPVTPSIKLVQETARRQRPALALGVGLPQAALGDKAADRRQRHLQRPIVEHALGLGRRSGQDQLEILAVGQRVVKGPQPVGRLLGQAPGGLGQGDRLRLEQGPAPAFLGQPGQIQRQAVADVDARMQLVARVQRQGFFDAGLEIEVMAEDAPAQRR